MCRYIISKLAIFTRLSSWVAFTCVLFCQPANSITRQQSAFGKLTFDFMQALIDCEPGTYEVGNKLIDFTGSPILKNKILGKENNICMVEMDTPDGRLYVCKFGRDAMYYINDQILLEGLFVFDYTKPNIKSLIAEEMWSKIRQYNCAIYHDY